MEEPHEDKVIIKQGKLVYQVRYSKIKLILTILVILFFVDVLFSLKLLLSAIQIRLHIGYFINLISTGDGDILPSLQAVPVFLFLILDILIAFTIFKVYSTQPTLLWNHLMFAVFLTGLGMLLILFFVSIAVLGHAYSAHASLHDGITTAMSNYSNNVLLKAQMDRLQIEFQCCGSKKYDEWYAITWYDPSLHQLKKREEPPSSTESVSTETAETTPKPDLPTTEITLSTKKPVTQLSEDIDTSNGNVPFSCCSMKSLFPCVHHDIEITGKSYLYTPEYNLSISTRGCYDIIREKKQAIGWIIVGNMVLYILLQALTIGMLRFIQTAQFVQLQFNRKCELYTIWIFGRYVGKEIPEKVAPEVPPIPEELKT